jgi:hypothetical protein
MVVPVAEVVYLAQSKVLPGGMVREKKLSIDERRDYLKAMQKRYVGASKAERGRMLDDMEAITGLHRKSLIRLLAGSLERKPRTKRRGRT